MKNNNILITRPLHDTPTKYLHCLAGELKKEIDNIGEYNILDLEKEKAVRSEFEKALDKFNPRLIILHGHGSYDCVNGQYEIILDKDNAIKLESKIIYSVVCDSSLELGEFAVERGRAEAYVGYEANYMIIIEPDRSTTPTKDKSFRPFKETYITFVISLLSGLPIAKCIEETKNHSRKLIREYGIRGIKDQYGDAPLIRFALFWNLFFLKAHGNMDAVF